MIKLERMIHYTHKTGSIDKICKIEMKEEGMQIEYCLENTEKFCIQSETESFFNPLQIAEVFKRELIQRDVSGTFTGDLKYIYTWKKNKQTYFVALTESDEARNYFSIIYTLDEKNKKKPSKHLLSHRIWERDFFAENGAKVYPLRFRITPGEWPDIKINEADFTDQDIMSYAFEVHFTFDDVCDEEIRIKLPYQEILWKTKEKKLICHGYELEVPNVEKACFSCFFDQCVTEIICDNNVLIVLNQMPKIDKEKAAKNVSGNLDNIRIQKNYNPKIQVLLQHGTVATKIYGLRGIEYSDQAKRSLKQMKTEDKLLYKNSRFSVFSNHIEDKSYGKPNAYIINPYEIVSVDRIVEEFSWRKTKWGDMTRKSWRTDIWNADSFLGNYPRLCTQIDALDAVWNLAIRIFQQCTYGGYSLTGQEGMWQAGLFQGPGEGFGVWLRDSVHISLRGGVLIDPEVARSTLSYAIKKGFDNGSDGPALGAVGIWDYYLATGDKAMLFENYEALLTMTKEMEQRYDVKYDLVKAEQSTSNDAFEEPENAGFSLGSECYYMRAFECMSQIEKVVRGATSYVHTWREKSKKIKESIQRKYWHEDAGYFTSGPIGSESYQNKMWETSGEEAVVWNKFGIASERQKSIILNKGIREAMTPYGIQLFPHRKDYNHFIGSIWPVWESGFASACSDLQRKDILLMMIAQQMRTAILHKNFYEVLEADSGKSWRWPGQLWHAAGFVSQVLYGLFGISYSEKGMSFNPCVPEVLGDISISNFRYQGALLDIKINGTGKKKCVILDNKEIHYLPNGLSGKHTVSIEMKN